MRDLSQPVLNGRRLQNSFSQSQLPNTISASVGSTKSSKIIESQTWWQWLIITDLCIETVMPQGHRFHGDCGASTNLESWARLVPRDYCNMWARDISWHHETRCQFRYYKIYRSAFAWSVPRSADRAIGAPSSPAWSTWLQPTECGWVYLACIRLEQVFSVIHWILDFDFDAILKHTGTQYFTTNFSNIQMKWYLNQSYLLQFQRSLSWLKIINRSHYWVNPSVRNLNPAVILRRMWLASLDAVGLRIQWKDPTSIP